jgi:hypothetical protein
MKKFLLARLSRDEFVAWMGGDHRMAAEHRPAPTKPPYEDGAVTLLWDESEAGNAGQPLIAVPSDGMRDFFAFVGTYIATYRPYSTFFRVVPIEIIPALEERRVLVGDVLRRVASVVAGSALSEVHLRTGGRGVSTRAQMPTIMATLSASLGQAVIAGYPSGVLDWLAKQWHAIHRRTNGSVPEQAETDQIVLIWKLISDATREGISDAPSPLGRSHRIIARFLADAIRSRGVDKALLLSLASSMSVNVDPAKILASSREERIRAFNDFVVSLDPSSHDPLPGQFLAGLLLAISGNGALDLLRSSKELANRSPISIVWFGVCAALFEESNVLTTANCVGRRLVRDLQRPQGLFDPPRADLNSYEYILLRRETGALDQVNSQSADSLEIELMANVTTSTAKYDENRDARFAEDVEVLAESLQEIRSVVERAQRRLRYASPPRQGELIRSDQKPRSRPR